MEMLSIPSKAELISDKKPPLLRFFLLAHAIGCKLQTFVVSYYK
jgi:hypothetical protein